MPQSISGAPTISGGPISCRCLRPAATWRRRVRAGLPDYSPDAKKIADLAKQAMVTLDPAKQQQICYEAQRLMNQVGPYAWLFEANIQVGYRKDVIKSLATNPVWYVDVGSIELV